MFLTNKTSIIIQRITKPHCGALVYIPNASSKQTQKTISRDTPPSMDSSILTDNTYNPGKFQTFSKRLKHNPASTISTML